MPRSLEHLGIRAVLLPRPYAQNGYGAHFEHRGAEPSNMDIALPRTYAPPARTALVGPGRTKYREPGSALAVTQMVFVLAAEGALVVLLILA